MSWIMLALVAVPAVAATATAIAAMRQRGRPEAGGSARSTAIWVSGALVIGAVALLIDVAVGGRLDLVAADGDERAVIGLTAGRIEAALVLLTSFVGLIVQAFAARSLVGDASAHRFHALALGLVAATNLTALAVSGMAFAAGWIATSLLVAGLVGHRRGWRVADQAVRRTRATLAIGDLALLVAIIVATVSAGHFDLRALDDVVVGVDSGGAITLIAVLLVVAGMVRSALIPFAGWLPTTLAAPTPVSALLHAGVVNGAGVLLIRFHPVLLDSAPAFVLAFVAGVATATIATAVMIVRTDVKGGLVWSTVGQMGFMVAQLGAGAFAAAFFHLVGHAMYKAAAFLGAGDAISARTRREFRPGRHGAASPSTVGASLVIGAGAVAGALLVLDPHLTDAATVLVATFATSTIARAVHGWLVSSFFAAGVVVPAAAGGAVAAAFAYVGGLKIVEGFVADVVPFEVPDAVGAGWVVAAIAGIAIGGVVVTRLPGDLGSAVRAAVYGRLVSFGSSAAPADGGPIVETAPIGATRAKHAPTFSLVGTVGSSSPDTPHSDSHTSSHTTARSHA